MRITYMITYSSVKSNDIDELFCQDEVLVSI